MKKLCIAVMFSWASFLGAAVETRGPVQWAQVDLPTFCDQSYASNMQSVLMQFSGFTPKTVLKSYQDYMIWVKRYEDLTLKVHGVENLYPNLIAQLRTPITKYNDCRTQRTVYPVVISGDLCDQTYAAYMQTVLKQLAPVSTPNEMAIFEKHLVNLKRLADAGFKTHAFEHETDLSIYSALRSPAAKYNDCRDASTRIYARVQ